jgi:hypothetical protein
LCERWGYHCDAENCRECVLERFVHVSSCFSVLDF